MTGGGGGGESRTVSETRIPQELVPFVRAQSRIGLGALQRQEQQLTGAGAEELVAPFTDLQQQGFTSALQQATGEDGVIPEVTRQLRATAGGGFLFGNPAFDEAVQASIRAAQPSILSTFGRAGGTPGGLAQTAIQQVASDSFANLFGQERARQQQAQLALPQLSLIPSDVLSSIGGEQQALQQRQLLAPITANESLIQAAGGGIPLASLLGQSTTTSGGAQRSTLGAGLSGALGGAATGAALGSVVPGIGTGIGAIGGGLLGGLGGFFG